MKVVDNEWAVSSAYNGFQIQLSGSYYGAHVDWDYVRFASGPPKGVP